MTDNEIIKAETDNRREYVKRIVNAVNYKGSDDHEDVWSILWEYQKENRDTINRQKAEIERLNKELVKNKADNRYIQRLEALFKCASMGLKTAKTEAIKEFAERLCEDRVSNDPVVIAVKVELKAMVGDNNGNTERKEDEGK